MPHDANIQLLLNQCILERDENAWERFVRLYSGLVWSAIHKTFKTASFPYTLEDAEDLYSAFFLSLVESDFRKLRQFQARNNCSLSTWLTVVAVRQVIDHMRLRHSLRMKSLDQDCDFFDTLPHAGSNAETILLEQERYGRLEKAVSALHPGDRALFDLLAAGDIKPEAAARKLGISLSSFYTKKHRLIEKIKKC